MRFTEGTSVASSDATHAAALMGRRARARDSAASAAAPAAHAPSRVTAATPLRFDADASGPAAARAFAARWASALVPAVPDRGRGAKRPNRTQIAIAMRTFFHDVLQAGVVVRGRATLDAVHDVTCRSVRKSGGYAVSHPRARGERGFEPDSANDAHHGVSGSHRSLDARSRGVRGSRRERSRRVRTYPSTGGARRGRSRPGRWYR